MSYHHRLVAELCGVPPSQVPACVTLHVLCPNFHRKLVTIIMTFRNQRHGICALLYVLALCIATVKGNAEKVIFVAPPVSKSLPALDNIYIDTLSPTAPGHSSATLGTRLPVSFPSVTYPKGRDSWILLRGLRSAQRYEARVCWAAIQPTEFNIKVHEISQVLNQPQLHQRLLEFSKNHPSTGTKVAIATDGAPESVLLLQIQAAADFFTSNDTLMQNPPPVNVDIILDPYLGGIFPQSLVSIAVYIVILAVGGYYLSGRIWEYLQLASSTKDHKD